MAITFDHAVKYHGKYYKPGEPIEEPVLADETDEEADQAAQDAAQEPETAEDEEIYVASLQFCCNLLTHNHFLIFRQKRCLDAYIGCLSVEGTNLNYQFPCFQQYLGLSIAGH